MAIYEFDCKQCNNIVERKINISEVDNWIEICSCGQVRKRLISLPGYIWSPTRGKK